MVVDPLYDKGFFPEEGWHWGGYPSIAMKKSLRISRYPPMENIEPVVHGGRVLKIATF